MGTDQKSKGNVLKVKYQFPLRTLIVAKGFRSMLEFAETIGVPQQTISEIIRGYALPSPNVLEKICRGLEITESDFAGLLLR
jgi:transcriptional regulator with XRE-family HTH domain